MATFSTMIRRGGHPFLRWTVRCIVLAAIIACGFIHWNYEIGGPCRLVPSSQIGVRAQIADEIVKIHIEEGDWVEVGQLIAELAVRDERAGVERSAAEVKQAKARLALLKTGGREEDIAIAQQRVELWRMQFAYFDREFQRNEELYKEKATSLSDVERSKQARDAAEIALISAQESLGRLKKGPREEEILAMEAEVERREVELRHFEEQAALGVISAPMAGRIVTKDVGFRVGQVVQPGDVIAVIHDTARLQAEVAADEAAAVRIQPGMPTKMRFYGTDGTLLTGRVIRVAWDATEESDFDNEPFRSDRESRIENVLNNHDKRRIRIDVELDPHQLNLLPGMTGQARIVIKEDLLWSALLRPVLRFLRVDVWSWLP